MKYIPTLGVFHSLIENDTVRTGNSHPEKLRSAANFYMSSLMKHTEKNESNHY